jgi:hypothetical protein
MPYITKIARYGVEEIPLEEWTPGNAGELNYVISSAINRYLTAYGLSYSNVNEMIGALECCKLELYRRVAAPYEDTKCKENGDVYTN